jgi:hypothetical protein
MPIQRGIPIATFDIQRVQCLPGKASRCQGRFQWPAYTFTSPVRTPVWTHCLREQTGLRIWQVKLRHPSTAPCTKNWAPGGLSAGLLKIPGPMSNLFKATKVIHPRWSWPNLPIPSAWLLFSNHHISMWTTLWTKSFSKSDFPICGKTVLLRGLAALDSDLMKECFFYGDEISVHSLLRS